MPIRRGAIPVLTEVILPFVLLTFPAASSAQAVSVVRGRVLDEDGATAIPGALVQLLGESDVAARTLSGADGFFLFRVSGGGRFTLRGEMIGRETALSDTFNVVVDSAVYRDIVLAPRPVRLAGLDVTREQQCRIAAEVGRATELVWEEVRKALRAESATRELAQYEFDIVAFERRFQDAGERLLVDRRDTIRVTRHDPFSSLPPDELARNGYARDENGVTYIYAPNTDALLSTAFLETHCFRLERSRDAPGRIGLAFEPLERRRETEIEGVLWVDEATSELRRLEFRYRNLPRGLVRGDYTGLAEFLRLPSGGMIIREWALRTPMRTGARPLIREIGGEVVATRVAGNA